MAIKTLLRPIGYWMMDRAAPFACRSNVLGFGAAAVAMGIFLRSLDTLLFNNEDRRVARAEQERLKLQIVEERKRVMQELAAAHEADAD